MNKEWKLGNLFHKNEVNQQEQAVPAEPIQNEEEQVKEKDQTDKIVYLPEMKDALRHLWELWDEPSAPTRLSLRLSGKEEDRERALKRLEQERLRLIVQIERDAKKRMQLIEKGKTQENFSLDSSCRVYLSKDRMLAWAFFFPPVGPHGKFEVGELGKALQNAGVTTGIDSDKVVQLLQGQVIFELIPIAVGTEPVEGKDGSIIELYAREMPREVMVDAAGNADYRAVNYVRQIEKDVRICNIISPQEGIPGVQVDGKIVNPKPVKAARVPRGSNTVISEDGKYLLAARDGHLEFADGVFHVRPLLEIKSDVDYETGNIDFNGDVHISGDVREGFEVHATGTVTIDGLVEAATVEAGGDLIISHGCVGDYQAMLRSKGCVRVKYLENCVVYAGKTIYADCIMTSQIFSDDSVNVTSGRGSIIGGTVTATQSVRAKMIGAQSGRRTELTLGTLPYVQTEQQNIEEELKVLCKELEMLEQNITYMEQTAGMNVSDPRQAKLRMRRSVLAMREKKLRLRQKNLALLHPNLSKCRLEADMVYPITTLRIEGKIWSAKEIRHRCRIVFDAEKEEFKEIC